MESKSREEYSNKEDGRPSFQFYPRDWLADAELRMCSLATQGLWINLLCIMWSAPVRGVLMYSPDGVCYNKMDNKRIARSIGCTPEEIDVAIAELLENGVASIDKDGFLYSRRQKRDAYVSEERSKAGKKGMESRWKQRDKITNGDSVITKSITKHNPSTASSSSTATATANKKPSAHPGFDEFYQAYPRHEGKTDALKAWNSTKPDLPAVLTALEWQRQKWTDPKYVPLPATYLRGRRWEDERTASQPAPKKPKVDPSDPQYAEIMELLK